MSSKSLPCLILTAILAFTGSVAAQDKKTSDQHAALLNQTLKEIIDAGAKIYNDNGDHVGCYRMWQGSLMSIKPFVPPDMQASIDTGLAGAEKLDNFADKAFALRKVMDDIRAKTKGAAPKVGGSKTDGLVAGRVVYEGKPVSGGTLTLVADGKKFSGAIADGTFRIQMVPLGDYRVAIEAKGVLPARYKSADTSGLSIRVQAGEQTVNLELVK